MQEEKIKYEDKIITKPNSKKEVKIQKKKKI